MDPTSNNQQGSLKRRHDNQPGTSSPQYPRFLPNHGPHMRHMFPRIALPGVHQPFDIPSTSRHPSWNEPRPIEYGQVDQRPPVGIPGQFPGPSNYQFPVVPSYSPANSSCSPVYLRRNSGQPDSRIVRPTTQLSTVSASRLLKLIHEMVETIGCPELTEMSSRIAEKKQIVYPNKVVTTKKVEQAIDLTLGILTNPSPGPVLIDDMLSSLRFLMKRLKMAENLKVREEIEKQWAVFKGDRILGISLESAIRAFENFLYLCVPED